MRRYYQLIPDEVLDLPDYNKIAARGCLLVAMFEDNTLSRMSTTMAVEHVCANGCHVEGQDFCLFQHRFRLVGEW